jgi:Holliday junction resolvasome RuvABC endonuclease subunit
MKADTILGIDPGTKLVGIGVVRGKYLVHYQVQAFHGAWSYRKLKAIVMAIDEVLRRHAVTHVKVKVPDKLPGTTSYAQLIGSLNVLFESKRIRPRYHSFSEVKARHCKNEKANSKDIWLAILKMHPELMPEYKKELSNENAYYYKAFEAVAVAYMK